MATKNHENLSPAGSLIRRIKWEELGDDDVGDDVNLGHEADGTIQAVGTFGGATFNFQGSNDGTNWFNLTDESGNEIALTSAGGKIFLPRVWKVRPKTSGGSGTDIDAYLLIGSQ